jgi:ABC-type protease/lipase transport system fused ATPase/permease subunit
MANVHEMVLQLPAGYDTRIGQGGQSLSGGQRQRVGLARALYGKPRLVVLDEPNSNLDHAGEAALAAGLAMLRQTGATIIVVTHRPSILTGMDKILVLNNGTVERFGPREEVLSALVKPVAMPSQRASAGSPMTAR